MELRCPYGVLNLVMWKSRLHKVAIFLLFFTCCWSESNTFEAPDRTAMHHTRSNIKLPNMEPNTIPDGTLRNDVDNGFRMVLDVSRPTEPSRQLDTTRTTETAPLPEIGITQDMVSSKTPLTTSHRQNHGKSET